MARDDPRSIPAGRERPDLAELLADQFALIDEVRPRELLVIEADDVLIFAFTWPFIPADEAVAASALRGRLVRLRRLLLEDITEYLTEVVEIELGRAVTGARATLGEDPRDATVSFLLGTRAAGYGDEGEALRNWAGQVRRQARELRLRLRARRRELRTMRRRNGSE